MRTRFFVGFLLATASFAFADDEAETTARWVRQLGHPRFVVREEAERRLLSLADSPGVAEAVRAAQSHLDLEVAQRAKRMLPQLLPRMLARRMAAYLPAGQLNPTATADALAVHAATILRLSPTLPDLLVASDLGESERQQTLLSQFQVLANAAQQSGTPETRTAVRFGAVFVACQLASEPPGVGAVARLIDHQFVSHPLGQELAAKWIERDSDLPGQIDRLAVAYASHLPADRLIDRWLRIPSGELGKEESEAMLLAIAVLGESNVREFVRRLAPALADARPFPASVSSDPEIQIRDVVLGTLLRARGVDLGNFGLGTADVLVSRYAIGLHLNVPCFPAAGLRQRGFSRAVQEFAALGLEQPPAFAAEADPGRLEFVDASRFPQVTRPARTTARLEVNNLDMRMISAEGAESVIRLQAEHGLEFRFRFTSWSLSPDGGRLATGLESNDRLNGAPGSIPTSRTGAIRVWDTKTGNLLGHYVRANAVEAVWFLEDGKTIGYRTTPPRVFSSTVSGGSSSSGGRCRSCGKPFSNCKCGK